MIAVARLIASLIMASTFAVAASYAFLAFGPQARLMPLLISVPGLSLSLAQLKIDFRAYQRAPQGPPALDARQIRIAAWLLACPLVIILLGFDLGGPLMVAAFHRFVVRERLLLVIVSTLVTFVLVAVVLDKLMGGQFFGGLLQSLWSTQTR